MLQTQIEQIQERNQYLTSVLLSTNHSFNHPSYDFDSHDICSCHFYAEVDNDVPRMPKLPTDDK
eukprot:Pgem_evm1s5601